MAWGWNYEIILLLFLDTAATFDHLISICSKLVNKLILGDYDFLVK